MSFYFDDDNDDQTFSQNFRTSQSSQSQQKQVTFSQSSFHGLLSQLSTASPEKQSSSLQFLTPSQKTPKKSKSHGSSSSFVCPKCGAVDQYYLEHGMLTCSNCFTQSQAQLEEELDYDDTQHMAARNRDGTLRRVNKAKNENSCGFGRGRPKIPLAQLDKTQKPPSLEACLHGFTAILQKSCKILCWELLPTLEINTTRPTEQANANDSDESDVDVLQHSTPKRYSTREQKKKLYRMVSKTVRNLWKAYLLSWKEGADFYSNLYPQIRFALRDQFLGPDQRAILYQTIAAKVEEQLTQQIKQEVNEEEAANHSDTDNDDEDDSSRNSNDSDSDDESYSKRKHKRIKLESDDGENKHTELDSLCNLFHQSHEDEKIKSENVVSEDEMPIPNVVLSSNDQKAFVSSSSQSYIHHYHSRQRRRDVDNDINNNSANKNFSSLKGSDSESDCDNVHEDNENFSVASNLSIVDAAEFKHKSISKRKRKRKKQKETDHAYTTNPYAKMIYYHNKMMHLKSKSKKIPKLGRKEAALLIKPSMDLVLAILLVAASPHGITEGKLAEWVGNGSLPILDAFGRMLSEQQQKKLAFLAPFFSLPRAPDAAILKFLTRKIHVACGYKPPKVKLVKKRSKGRTLSSKSLVAAGRLVRPSSVPMILGYLVSELGLGQRVLNYSLALMGLPVSMRTLQAAQAPKVPEKASQNKSQPSDNRAEWDSDASPVFDLSKPEEKLRRKRYLAKMAQRRRRAKQRKKMGITVQAKFRNKKYSAERDVPDFVPGETNELLDNASPDLVSSQDLGQEIQRGDKATPAVNKEKTEWLPPALRSARPDKLSDIDQILAVVIVACKLIPNWERNHHYVFSQGQNSGGSNGIPKIEESMNGAEEAATAAGLLNFNSKDRFVPYNHEEFCRIGNGKTELEYLEFLKECIFRGSRYALPKFVESLNKSPSIPSDDQAATPEEGRVKEEECDEIPSKSFVQKEFSSAVVPNDIVLTWKTNPKNKETSTSPTRDTLERVPYQPTKALGGLRKPDGPLGPLIEYMAYKTATCPTRILDQLLELDEELASKGKPETPTLVLPPNVCDDFFMRETSARKKTRRAQPRNLTTPAAPIGTNTNNSNNTNERHKREPEIPPHDLSEYEQLRLRNIERNNARLEALGLLTPFATSTPSPQKKKRRIHPRTPTKLQPPRSSRNESPIYDELSSDASVYEV